MLRKFSVPYAIVCHCTCWLAAEEIHHNGLNDDKTLVFNISQVFFLCFAICFCVTATFNPPHSHQFPVSLQRSLWLL
jgi:hypothetical protein